MGNEIDKETGLPIDQDYLECGLSANLTEAIEDMKKSWELIDNGGDDLRWDCKYCLLQSEINVAEVEGLITREQAIHLRIKYLRMRREDIC